MAYNFRMQAADSKMSDIGDKRHDIRVDVKTAFLPDRSEPARNQYTFAYTITITNRGSVPAQLISRHWVITDGDGKVQEVRGLGVVGQQPLLQPGETFEYTSGATLATALGTMRGSYSMVDEEGQAFTATIPAFTLSVPRVLH